MPSCATETWAVTVSDAPSSAVVRTGAGVHASSSAGRRHVLAHMPDLEGAEQLGPSAQSCGRRRERAGRARRGAPRRVERVEEWRNLAIVEGELRGRAGRRPRGRPRQVGAGGGRRREVAQHLVVALKARPPAGASARRRARSAQWRPRGGASWCRRGDGDVAAEHRRRRRRRRSSAGARVVEAVEYRGRRVRRAAVVAHTQRQVGGRRAARRRTRSPETERTGDARATARAAARPRRRAAVGRKVRAGDAHGVPPLTSPNSGVIVATSGGRPSSYLVKAAPPTLQEAPPSMEAWSWTVPTSASPPSGQSIAPDTKAAAVGAPCCTRPAASRRIATQRSRPSPTGAKLAPPRRTV